MLVAFWLAFIQPVQIDEDSNERIMNCIQTLSELEAQTAVHEVFLEDTKMAFSKMLGAQEVCFVLYFIWIVFQRLFGFYI